jgi:hypothetical protein
MRPPEMMGHFGIFQAVSKIWTSFYQKKIHQEVEQVGKGVISVHRAFQSNSGPGSGPGH